MNAIENKLFNIIHAEQERREIRPLTELIGKQAHISHYEPARTKHGETFVFDLAEAPRNRYFASGAVKTFFQRCVAAGISDADLSGQLMQFGSATSKAGNTYVTIDLAQATVDEPQVAEPDFAEYYPN